MKNAIFIDAISFDTTEETVQEKLSAYDSIDQRVNKCQQVIGALTCSENEISKANQENEKNLNIVDQQTVADLEPQGVSVHEDSRSKILYSDTCNFLEPAHIFTPKPIDKTEFLKDRSPSALHKGVSSPEVYKFIKERYKIKVFLEDFYIFDDRVGIYRMLSASNFDRVINTHFGKALENPLGLACYYEVKEYAKRDHRLFISGKDALSSELWGFQNGVLNIETGELIENDGSFFLRHVLNCNFIRDAVCPVFDNYITSIAGDDGNLISLLWECVAYLLSRDTNAKKFFACIGKKDTGKSLFARILTGIIGEDAVSHLSANEFAGRFDSAGLIDKHLNISMDLPDRPLTAEAVGKIKSITGNDMIHADRKYKEPIDFKPSARLLFGSNAQIHTEQFDPAFNDRLVIIPFLYPVPKNCQDFNLEKKILMEKEGICRKAINVYLKLRRNGYHFTEVEWSDEGNSYVDYDTVIQKFSETFCKFTGRENDRVTSSELYAVFSDFCISKTVAPLALNEFSKKFKTSFEERVVKKKIKINGVSVWGFVGMKLESADITQSANRS